MWEGRRNICAACDRGEITERNHQTGGRHDRSRRAGRPEAEAGRGEGTGALAGRRKGGRNASKESRYYFEREKRSTIIKDQGKGRRR